MGEAIVDTKSREYTEAFINTYVAPAMAHLSYGNMLNNAKMEIFATPDVETAHVSYSYEKEKYLIFIGTQLEVFQNTRFKEDIKGLVRFLLMHEVGHILYTDMNFDKLNEELKRSRIPFDFLNLAEDLRVNHNIKRYFEKQTGVYESLNIEKYTGNGIEECADMPPEHVLYAIGVCEDQRQIRSIHYPKVYPFYERFIQAKNVYEVIDIARDWRNTFHLQNLLGQEAEQGLFDEPSESSENGMEEDGDLGKESMEKAMEQLSQSLGGDGGAEDASGENGEDESQEGVSENQDESTLSRMSIEDMAQTEESMTSQSFDKLMRNAISASNEEMENNVECPVDTSLDFSTLDGASNTESIFKPSVEYENEFNKREMVEEILPALSKIKAESKSRYTPSKKPTKRFNRKMLPTSPISFNKPLYKKKVNAPKQIGKKKMVFFCDLSGSMYGTPIIAQRTLVIALNRLAQMFRELEITIVGSKIMNGSSLYQGVRLPSNEKSLLSIEADGAGEGIGYAMKSIAKANDFKLNLSKQDVVAVVSDGRMSHKDIQELKESLSENIDKECVKLGIYVGREESANKAMSTWFDQLIIGDSLADAISEIVDVINNAKKYKTPTVMIEKEEELVSSPSLRR